MPMDDSISMTKDEMEQDALNAASSHNFRELQEVCRFVEQVSSILEHSKQESLQ